MADLFVLSETVILVNGDTDDRGMVPVADNIWLLAYKDGYVHTRTISDHKKRNSLCPLLSLSAVIRRPR